MVRFFLRGMVKKGFILGRGRLTRLREVEPDLEMEQSVEVGGILNDI
jgi:hypothetical protein